VILAQLDPAVAIGFVIGMCLVFGPPLLAVWLLVKLVTALMRRARGGAVAAGRNARASPGIPAKARAVLLDQVLLSWTPDDHLTLRDILNGGCIILGRPGSGKSSSSSFKLLKAAVDAEGSGGLICGASPSDLEMVEHIFSRHPGRLVVFDGTPSGHRFNVLNYLAKRPGASLNDVCAALFAVAEAVDRNGGQGGGDDGNFFETAARQLITYAVTVIYHATGKVDVADVLTFINTSATSKEELKPSSTYAEGFQGRCFTLADDKKKTEAEEYDYDLAAAHFRDSWPSLADRTRSSVSAVALAKLGVWNSGLNRLLFCTSTSISPAAMDQNKWIFCNMPPATRGVDGAAATGIWRFATQFHALKRDTRAYNPPLFIHIDEMHNTLNFYDTRFLGESRKFSSCMIACTQGRSSFYANMRGENAEAQVNALMNNFSHKIVHALADPADARWAADLAGEVIDIEIGGSERQPDGVLEEMSERGSWSGSFHEKQRQRLLASDFMHGFRCGGPRNDNLCDAILIRSGEMFSTGECYLRLAIRQPDLRR
jgi:hypothetical protein